MLAFLNEHYRKWAVVVVGHETQAVSSPTDDADYDSAKNFIGFNYSGSWGWDRVFTTTSCRWIALKVGRRRRTFSKDDITPNALPEPVPFITYDGYSNWPVIVSAAPSRLPKGQQWCSTDRYGLMNGPGRWKSYATSAAEDVLRPDAKKEVTEAWDKFKEGAAKKNWEAREKAGEITRSQWIDQHETLMAKCFKPLMVKAFGTMRDEMKRLDELWEAR